MNKLTNVYSVIGGDLDQIKQESCLERYVYHPFDDPELITPVQNPKIFC